MALCNWKKRWHTLKRSAAQRKTVQWSDEPQALVDSTDCVVRQLVKGVIKRLILLFHEGNDFVTAAPLERKHKQ